MKKVEDKDILNEKNSTKSNRNDKSEKETMDTLLSPQQKKNYFQSQRQKKSQNPKKFENILSINNQGRVYLQQKNLN